MKKMLFIAADSYPLNGAESIVNLKLLKALTNSGKFEVDLITKKNKSQIYPSNTLEELGIKLRSLNIIEVDNKISFASIWGHIKSFVWFGCVFKGSHWAAEALPTAIKLCKKKHYDYVLTKNASAPLVGYYLKNHFGLKWAATWNDPFPYYTYPKLYADFFGVKKDLTSKRLISIMRKADIHIFPSSQLRDYLLPYYKVSIDKTVIIPHVVNTSSTKNKAKYDDIQMIHSGNLSYPRDPQIFLEGFRMYLNEASTPLIKVKILGKTDDKLKSIIDKYTLTDNVKLLPPVSYKESLEVLANFDVALIIEARCPGIFLPTKVSDFMQAGLPIFAVSTEGGVLKDLYNNGNIPYLANNNCSESVKNALLQIQADFVADKIKRNKIPAEYSEAKVIEQYLKML